MLRVVFKLNKGKKLTFDINDEDELTIGRNGCHYNIKSSKVSQKHCLLRYRMNKLEVMDLDSANGTMVNGIKIKQISIDNGDVLVVGLVRFKVLSVDWIDGDKEDRTGVTSIEEYDLVHSDDEPDKNDEENEYVDVKEDDGSPGVFIREFDPTPAYYLRCWSKFFNSPEHFFLHSRYKSGPGPKLEMLGIIIVAIAAAVCARLIEFNLENLIQIALIALVSIACIPVLFMILKPVWQAEGNIDLYIGLTLTALYLQLPLLFLFSVEAVYIYTPMILMIIPIYGFYISFKPKKNVLLFISLVFSFIGYTYFSYLGKKVKFPEPKPKVEVKEKVLSPTLNKNEAIQLQKVEKKMLNLDEGGNPLSEE